jgi:hypothetical protein
MQWHKDHTKFRENRSSRSKPEMEGHTRHVDCITRNAFDCVTRQTEFPAYRPIGDGVIHILK